MRRQVWCVALTAVIGLALAVRGDFSNEVPADQAVPLESNVFEAPVRLESVEGVIDSGAVWGHSSPWVVDVDGDGVRDLIVGDFSGFFQLYRNEGSNQKPRYAKATKLQAGGVDAQVPIY
jgi:hypothetical protein